jgi:hypothetical protein
VVDEILRARDGDLRVQVVAFTNGQPEFLFAGSSWPPPAGTD